MNKIIAAALVASTGLFATGHAFAEYPEKPIKLVIPYKAGGGSDALARTIQAAIEKHDLMPQPLVVVNTDGAAGVVGARSVKDAKPDGYTFLQMHNEMFALAATGRLGFDPLEAYEPVAQTTQSCLYLAVPASSPYKIFDELVEGAKAQPGKLKLADIIGGLTHFASITMMDKLGIEYGIVQTGGTSARFASLKGGHTDMAFMSPGWIERGGDELRGLLWMGPTKPDFAGDMPTAAELDLGVEACLNRRFWAPAGTPQERVDYFAGVLEKVMQTPELEAYHEKRLSDIRFREGEELEAEIEAELASVRAGAEAVKQALQ